MLSGINGNPVAHRVEPLKDTRFKQNLARQGLRCRVDITRPGYSCAFSEALQQAWARNEKCATRPELQRYDNHVAA